MISKDQIQRAKEWASMDPNKVSSQYVNKLIDQESGELAKLFPENPSERIAFGTAGLRSTMKPGPLGMNDLVALQSAQGLAKYCLAENQVESPTVVVGYDHRANPSLQLSSLSFALLTVLVFQEAGFNVLLLDGYCFTPLVPFSMSIIENAIVGIMITASHNPKEDAGYKVYWNDGCQIRSPIDKGIASSIVENLEPWVDYEKQLESLREKFPDDPCLGLSDPDRTKDLVDTYFEKIESAGLISNQTSLQAGKPQPVFCYTAMHGVGHKFAVRSFKAFGLPDFVSVPSQQEPDPTFPTVPFPNPEELGALDLAQEYAKENSCNIILANDPDADRLAAAELVGGKWTIFTGDQIGAMLGLWLHENLKSSGKISMCASTVSSKLLAQIARVEGFKFEDTLTGFKWIGSRAAELSRKEGYRNIFCYEEAIGFCCGDVIFDKDGISAMGVFAELAVNVYARGLSMSEHLQSIYDKYGEFVSSNGYFMLEDMSVVPKLMKDMTKQGNFDDLVSVGPYRIASIRYLGVPGYDSTTTDKNPTLPCSSSSPMLTIRFENGCTAQFRASGTEPKFKYYIELAGSPGVPRDEVERELNEMAGILLEELLHPSANGLKRR